MNLATGVLLFWAIPGLLAADTERWTSVGPPEKWITDLVVAPSNSDILYAMAFDRIFGSDDGGRTWTLRHQGPPPLIFPQLRDLVVHPSIPSEVYAHNGSAVSRSTDGGRSWSEFLGRPVPFGGIIESLAAGPPSDWFPAISTLYAGATWYNDAPLPVNRGGLFKVIYDIGFLWLQTSLRGVGIRAIAVDPNDPSRVYANPYGVPVMTGANGRGVVKSTDGGVSWSAPLAQFMGLPPLTWIAVDPSRSQNVYAGTIFSHIYKSTDGGDSFQQIPLDRGIGSVVSLAIDPLDSSRLYAATSNGGVLRSWNGGLTWETLNCGLPNLTTTRIVVSDDGRVLHVGTRWGGILRYEVSSGGPTPCSEGNPNLCLRGGRFCVRVSWRSPDGRSGTGQAVPLTLDTGAFWFFDSSNLELMIKVLDGTRINTRYWVFYGALSNVGYDVTVTDNQTGRSRTYTNPQGQVASVTDTEAF